MALTPSLSFTQDPDDITIGTVTNTTPDYGTGGNPARNAAAEYILWSKTDQDGNRTYDNPDQGDVLTNLVYSVNTDVDGWYEGIRLRIQFYNAGASYVEEQSSGGVVTQYASVFYYGTTGKVYQAIAPSTGQSPTNTTYFEEVPELDVLIPNTNVDVFIEDFKIQTRSDNCISTKFANLEDCSCTNGNDKSNKNAYYLDGLLIAAESEWTQGNPEEYEKIIRQIEAKCSNC